MRQVIFNVGAGLCSYVEVRGRKILIDLGASIKFNPITDFLVPLFQRRGDRLSDDGKRYVIDQCIISHPHKDHLSAIYDLNQRLYPELLTCPNDKDGMPDDEKIDWDIIGNQTESWMHAFKDSLKDRKPPLRSIDERLVHLYWLKAKAVKTNDTLLKESYSNNISIVTCITSDGYTILLPGDIQKEGMSMLLNGNVAVWDGTMVEQQTFKALVGKGVDVLVAPHHGLRSSFSAELFKAMPTGKTRCLNVVSEKPNTDDNRNVDTRYSSTDFCDGVNSLSVDSSSQECQVRTSRGHIVIDYSDSCVPQVAVVNENNVIELQNYFMR